MATPPAKKIKREHEVSPPPEDLQTAYPHAFVITLPGIKVDTLVTIFERKYLLSSAILKLHSSWFRNLYDTTSQSRIETTKMPGTYQFAAQRGHGTWTLVGDFGDEIVHTYILSPHDERQAARAFKNVLSALCNKALECHNCSDIIALANLAETYDVLPSMTSAIDAAFFNNPELCKNLNENPCEMLCAAKKLRHKSLYNDCLILALGPHTSPRYMFIEDVHLWTDATEIYEKLRLRLESFSHSIFRDIWSGQGVAEIGRRFRQDSPSGTQGAKHNFTLPAFVRGCTWVGEDSDKFYSTLYADLLVNRLFFDKDARCGEGEYKDHFLSYKIDKFPWKEDEWA